MSLTAIAAYAASHHVSSIPKTTFVILMGLLFAAGIFLIAIVMGTLYERLRYKRMHNEWLNRNPVDGVDVDSYGSAESGNYHKN